MLATSLALGLALGGCSQRVIPPAPVAAPRPTPAPAPRPAAAPAANWQDAALTPGDWEWSTSDGRSAARFAGGLLAMRCDPASRSVAITLAGPAAGSGQGPASISVTASSLSRALSGSAQRGASTTTVSAPVSAPVSATVSATVSAVVAGSDPVLDAMAFSRGRFAIQASGAPALYVPSWAEIGRVIEDCR